MKKKILYLILLCICATSTVSIANPIPKECAFTKNFGMIKKNNYFDVTLDFNTGMTHFEIGKKYGCTILKAVPNYSELLDSYLKEVIIEDMKYLFLLNRALMMKKNIPKIYLEEIEGIASIISSGVPNKMGDGKISADELLILNLIPDVGRASQCAVLSVSDKSSYSKQTIIGRALDWRSGSRRQIREVQAFIKINYPNQTIISIGYLGFMGILTGLKVKNPVFTAILDSANGEKMPLYWGNFNSYSFDLRYALENFNNLEQISNFMSKKTYSFNHLIFLADSSRGTVLENNLNRNRVLRNPSSKLHAGIIWPYKNILAAVNSFLLKENFNNHTKLDLNTKRFDTIKSILRKKKTKLDINDLKDIFTFYHGKAPATILDGDIYNKRTQQIILYDFAANEFSIFFAPKKGLPLKPEFVKINSF